jgi:sensor histidine kinase YesM
MRDILSADYVIQQTETLREDIRRSSGRVLFALLISSGLLIFWLGILNNVFNGTLFLQYLFPAPAIINSAAHLVWIIDYFLRYRNTRIEDNARDSMDKQAPREIWDQYQYGRIMRARQITMERRVTLIIAIQAISMFVPTAILFLVF